MDMDDLTLDELSWKDHEIGMCLVQAEEPTKL